MLARVFPAHHPRKGEPTYFVEKTLKGLPGNTSLTGIDIEFCLTTYGTAKPKLHTVRAGKRWKTGYIADIRVWSGQPYKAPQEKLVKVPVTVYDFQICYDGNMYSIRIDGKTIEDSLLLIENDGLTLDEFTFWFELTTDTLGVIFDGQLICWGEVKY